jgi:hypothetical protein
MNIAASWDGTLFIFKNITLGFKYIPKATRILEPIRYRDLLMHISNKTGLQKNKRNLKMEETNFSNMLILNRAHCIAPQTNIFNFRPGH